MFDRDRIQHLFERLADELDSRGVHGDLFLVGGGAMAVAYDARRATRDLDAVFEPKRVIYDVAARLAELEELPDGWLNDAVKGFLRSLGRAPRH